jgi:putative radical SAM enzyme (TIGR03279 family)
MPVRILRVEGVSGFFRPGDEIVSIDGRPVSDQLDAIFLAAGEGRTVFTVARGGRERSRTLSPGAFARARLVFEEMRFIRCRSRCVFCFMDQMPPGLRPSLYEKDDDYRLSFLYGNFVTLNDVTGRELGRIASLGLSPLFVSVHAVDRRVRERIFGRPMRRDIMSDLRRLARAGITIHAQIVLVPGVNDGASLDRTVAALGNLYPRCRSAAVVPVGVTAHRAGLPTLRRPAAAESRGLVQWAERLRARYRARTGGESFLHLADEIYLAAGRALPPDARYDGYPQLSNGVGMCRLFLEELRRDAARLGGGRRPRRTTVVVTGDLGARFIRRYAAPLLARELPGYPLRVLRVPNALFGRDVGVSGLLAGRDIIRAARRERVAAGCLVLPANAVNHAGRLIDDLRPADIGRAIGVPVIVARGTFLESNVIRRSRGGRRA